MLLARSLPAMKPCLIFTLLSTAGEQLALASWGGIGWCRGGWGGSEGGTGSHSWRHRKGWAFPSINCWRKQKNHSLCWLIPSGCSRSPFEACGHGGLHHSSAPFSPETLDWCSRLSLFLASHASLCLSRWAQRSGQGRQVGWVHQKP